MPCSTCFLYWLDPMILSPVEHPTSDNEPLSCCELMEQILDIYYITSLCLQDSRTLQNFLDVAETHDF